MENVEKMIKKEKVLIIAENFIKKLFMHGLYLIKSFIQHASAGGYRSTVLKPIGGILGMFLGATLLAFYFKMPSWVGKVFVGSSLFIVSVFLFSYIYCMFTDKDALRSERFFLQKMAIEKGLVGDDSRGLFQQSEKKEKLIPAPNSNLNNIEN